MTLHTKPSQGEQQLNKQQQEGGGGRAAVFGRKMTKRMDKYDLSRCYMTNNQKKTSSRHFLTVSVSTLFLYSFFRQLESHNGYIL